MKSVKIFSVFLLFLSLNSIAQEKITIKNELQFNLKSLVLNTNYSELPNDTLSLETVKFYISNLQIHYKNGTISKEKNSFHLLDFENLESLQFELEKSTEKIESIRFSIGIDSLTNVSGALGGDLDATKGMYWAWQSGYINLKIEGKSSNCKTRKNKFQFHIGGYLKPFYAMRTIILPVNNTITNNTLTLKYDISKLFSNINLKEFHTVMIPSEKAMQFADDFQKIISIE